MARRPDVGTPASCYAPCILCLGFYSKSSLHTHIKRCLLRESGDNSKAVDSYQESILMLQAYLPSTDELDSIIIFGMKDTLDNEGIFQCNSIL